MKLAYFGKQKKSLFFAPFFKLLEAIMELAVPIILAYIIDEGIKKNDTKLIIICSSFLFGLSILGYLFSLAGQYFASLGATTYASNLRRRLFEKIVNLRAIDRLNFGKDELINFLNNDSFQVQTGINMLLRLILRSPFIVFGSAIFVTIFYPSVSYLFWIAIPILFVIAFLFLILALPRYKKNQERLDQVLLDSLDSYSGVRTIRAFGLENKMEERFDEKNKDLYLNQKKVAIFSSILNPLTYGIINIFIVILLYVATLQVDAGILVSGGVVATYNYMAQILVELLKLASLVITISKAASSAKRIDRVLKYENKPRVSFVAEQSFIKFEDVSFAYPNANPLFDHLNVEIKKGEKIGIIGGIGSGKSTFAKLLMGEYLPQNGRIIFEGVDLNGIEKADLNEKMACAFQNELLFEGTILDNFQKAKHDATEEEIIAAATLADFERVIDKKGGLSSPVFLAGSNFSGGEKERFALARTLLLNRDILILDDVTSSLDDKTKTKVLDNIFDNVVDKNLFIISQDASVVKRCDRIMVFEKGALVGFDKASVLEESNKIYQEILASQEKREVHYE